MMPRRHHGVGVLLMVLLLLPAASAPISPLAARQLNSDSGSGGSLVFAISDVTLAAPPRLLEAFDADGDGALELIVLGTGFAELDYQVSVLDNDGSGAFSTGWSRPHPADSDARVVASMASEDVDLDGDLDIAVTPGGSDWSVRLNHGDGELDTYLTSTWFGGYAGSPAFADINADGLPDLAHYTEDFGSYIDWGEGLGDGNFPEAGFWFGNPYDNGTLTVFADMDENGSVEPVLSTDAGIYRPSGSQWIQLVPGAFRGHGVMDLDGDQHLDIVFADPIGDRIGVVLGAGDGSVSSPSWFDTGREPDQLVVADVDGDGEWDVVTGNVDQGSISILLGDGAGGFGPRQDIPTGPGPLGLAAGDFDLDGDMDLAVADAGSTTVTVLLQQTTALGAGR